MDLEPLDVFLWLSNENNNDVVVVVDVTRNRLVLSCHMLASPKEDAIAQRNSYGAMQVTGASATVRTSRENY